MESAWAEIRSSINDTPYLGSTFGLLLAARFGSSAVVPWHRLRESTRIDELIGNVFVPLDECAAIEAKLSHDESFMRDEYLAERRAG